ncbi:MAG: phospholipid carrier-dependent glycosyltransferase [Candidatus Omnitrophota bacterium]
MPEISKKITIALIVGGLCAASFFILLNNFKKPNPRTVDEVVYYTMARQMQDNIFAYNTTGLALHDFMTQGKEYPDYFYKPLFKHPPLFTLLIMLSVKMFGPTALGAGFFPIFLGSLSIALVYLIGRMVGGRIAGLLAAGFMFIDPVLIMSSQKVWMDAPLMFFMLLTVYSYWKAIREKKDSFFLMGGLAAGAAFMVKYPGILTFLTVILFVILSAPEVFRNRKFLLSLVLPFLVSVPWFALNFYVYGQKFITDQLAVHDFNSVFSLPVLVFGIGMAILILSATLMFYHPDMISRRFTLFLQKKGVFYLKMLAWVATIAFVLANVPRSLDFFEVPAVSWTQGAFAGKPRWFYFERLLRFSLTYGFAYLAFFDPFHKTEKGLFLMKLNAVIIMVFFAAWGNFQCRYILPSLPFLLVMSGDYVWKLFKDFAEINIVFLRLTLQSLLLVFIVLAVSKTILINFEVSFTNFMCYF